MDQAEALREMTREADMLRRGGPAPDGGRGAVRCAASSVRVVAVTSGKGGVGKTNISANLAYFLTRKKRKTLILDADLGLANIDVILGLTPRYNLHHVLSGERRLSEAMIQGPGGIRILPSSSGIQEMSELSQGQKLLLLDELDSLEQELDFMLIDTGAGISGNVMYFNMAAGEIIVVTSPEPTAMTDAYALIKILYQRHAKKRFLLLVNMVRSAAEGREVFQRLSHAVGYFLNLQISPLGHIVQDEHITEAVKRQQIFAERYPESPAAVCLRAVADRLCREKPPEGDTGGLRFLSRKTREQ
ncbi:MAG: Flagellum site-determining protein YlxH [Syntrophaceae bacterium PtaU1.Bin231]|nr:MAG: Flagellum site-determining protein YlxH [Syntrophaceae bacterium PtaU1.Bin231]HOG16761.1 MinD/ParA family protein [Syntrophales bacterium]